MAKVSVIVPIYGVEKYLRKCLDSLLNQTLKDIEIICVNDCTLDNSFEIVKEYASKDPRFVLIEHETNQGQGIARNNAIAVAHGECIGFVDPDDWIEPDMYQAMYDALKKYDADMVETKFFVHYESSGEIKRLRPDFRFPRNKSFNCHSINKKYPFKGALGATNKLIKSDFIRQNDISFGVGTFQEDMIFTVKCRLFADKIYFCNRNLYHYLARKNSSTDNGIAPEKALTIVKMLENIHSVLIADDALKFLHDTFIKCAIERITGIGRFLPDDHKQSFENYALQFIPEKYRSYYISRKNSHYRNFGEKLFSVKNLNLPTGRFKILTVLGIRIPLKRTTLNNFVVTG